MIDLFIWGAGGHGKVVCDCAVAAGYRPAFLDDDPVRHGTVFYGLRVYSPDQPPVAEARFVIAIGCNRARAGRFHSALNRGWQPLTLVHGHAIASPSATLGAGVVVMPGAVINAAASIGSNTIVNTGAVVEHDCRIGEHSHLAPRCTLGGGVTVGSMVLTGIGSSVLPGITIGDGARIGAGAVVIRDVAANVSAAGVPARPILCKEHPL